MKGGSVFKGAGQVTLKLRLEDHSKSGWSFRRALGSSCHAGLTKVDALTLCPLCLVFSIARHQRGSASHDLTQPGSPLSRLSSPL